MVVGTSHHHPHLVLVLKPKEGDQDMMGKENEIRGGNGEVAGYENIFVVYGHRIRGNRE